MEIFFRLLEEYDTDLDEMEDLLKREKLNKKADTPALSGNDGAEENDYSINR